LTKPADQTSAPSPLLGIVGPTATGKSDLAMALAGRLPIEIVVADSRQVYHGMDVGTAKPQAESLATTSHHLLNLVDPNERFTVADWVVRARELLPEIAGRGKLPMLVGGTGLYIKALLDGHHYTSAAWSSEVHARLDDELERSGLEPMAARLCTTDPTAAARTDLRNPRRVIRALERLEAGDGGVNPPATPYPGRVALIGISRPRDVIYRRIDDRAREMFESGGLLAEVRSLLDAGFGADLRPMTGHGYREAARHLAGEWSLEEAIDRTARRTRQYAKRQLTWFRGEPRIMWLSAGERPGDDPALVADAERLLRAALS
jgi:tRNA dimethylallyltransferase